MDFNLSEEHLMVQEAARNFAETELLPGVIDRDEKGVFPTQAIQKMGQLGFLGMMVKPEHGGSGLDTLAYVLMLEEIAKIDASAAVAASVNNSLVCWGLETYANAEQQQKYLHPLASGQKLGAFCLSEPEAGSDASHQKTTALDRGDHYVLNGTKNWITNGSSADYYLIIAQSHPELGVKGMNTLIVEKNTPGFQIGPRERKMGIRASDTHSLIFNDIKVPKSQRIGPEGFGFTFAMKTLAGGRIGIAAQALGIAAGAYEHALKYARERKTFGVPISNHQAIAFKLADIHTQIEAARLLVYKAALDKDQGADYNLSSATAKLYASQVAMDTTIEAVQILGGNGYVKEYHVERMMRDAKITQIYEGTSEIQKMIISRSILK